MLGENNESEKFFKFKIYSKSLDLVQKEITGYTVGCSLHKLLLTPKNQDPNYSKMLVKSWNDSMSKMELTMHFNSTMKFVDVFPYQYTYNFDECGNLYHDLDNE